MAFLLGKRIRGRSLQQPLGDVELPPPIDPAIIDWIVFEYRSGCATPEMRTQLYEGHLRLAIMIAGQYAAQAPRKAADLVQEACLGIGIALNEAPEKLYDNNFTPFCAMKIHSRCSRFLNTDRVTGVPQTTFSKAKREDKAIEPVRVVSLTITTRFDKTITAEVDEERVPKGCSRPRRRHALAVKTHARMCDLKEMIAQSVKTEAEGKVITLRSQGYNDREIASILGVSNTQVNNLRSKVEARFTRMEQE